MSATSDPSVPLNLLNPGIKLDQIAGAVIAGILMNCTLYGVFASQAVQYFVKFRTDDALPLTILAIVLVLLATMSLFNSSAIMYSTFSIHFGEYDFLLSQGKTFLVYATGNAVTAIFVQSFLNWRLLRVSKNWIVCVVIEMVSLLSLIGASACVWITDRQSALSSRGLLTTVVTIWTCAAAATDILIVAFMLYYLSQMKSTFNRTSSLLKKLTYYVIPAGALPASFALAAFIGFKCLPNSQIPFTFNLPVGTLYGITFFYNLNMRQSLAPETSKAPVSYGSGYNSTGASKNTSGYDGNASIGLRNISVNQSVAEHIDLNATQAEKQYRFDDDV